jgi:hypothetical protein
MHTQAFTSCVARDAPLVDEALLSPFWKWIARTVAAAVLSLGIGLIRAARRSS